MKKMGIHEIRKEFLDFFESKGHLVHASYPLVPPANDKSLLLINAGMAPLKPYFLKLEEPPKHRMTTCQKCIRTGDIDNVGKTDRHGTFFEMLGNFSFQDYFKKEAVTWAWEFMTEHMGVPSEKLWVSVYENDDDAAEFWENEVGVPKNRIVRLGKEDNFWELTLGPCGPCSEIYIDRGAERGCGDPDCKPGCECDRFVEVWNLVFSEFDKDENGNYNKLAEPNIDTGMGLERMAVVMNDANNIFEVEPISTILHKVEEVSDFNYGDKPSTDVSIRIITDHARAMTFLIADGVLPSNEGRGYVLRRIIRRAHQHGKQLGISVNFLPEIIDVVVDNWGDYYPEIQEKRDQIKKIVLLEEEKFNETIEQGNQILDKHLNQMMLEGTKTLGGHDAFKLYDTYGFPLELTLEILAERGFDVDIDSFKEEMKKQKNRARQARLEGGNDAWDKDSLDFLDIEKIIETIFKGYEEEELDAEVVTMISDNRDVKKMNAGDKGIMILDASPFYAESGGQIGDSGVIEKDGLKIKVTDTQKGPKGLRLHYITVEEGAVSLGDKVLAKVETSRRKDIARNHSCTHLLHQALKDTLGEHVQQKGSLVTENRLRFDFSHFEGMTMDEIKIVEKKVNDRIFESLPVYIKEMAIDEARAMGAQALFGEKYGDTVRVVKMGDYSIELCGGTHVLNTNDIGIFKILTEAGISSGVRRIEAVTGREVYNYLSKLEGEINTVANTIKSARHDVVTRAESLVEEAKASKKEVERLTSKLLTAKANDLFNDTKEISGANVLVKQLEGVDMNAMREIGDKAKDKLGSVIVVLGTANGDKVNFMVSATDDLVKRGAHAGNLIREIAKIAGGGGGGRPNMAQAGGKDASKLAEALDAAYSLIEGQLK
ncbi:MAG: alanine--tRNA ligase [Tissierellales bacterium]|jgi:alanyl-tRNA synthetase|nr:alanine--tRNA ligase [Tissierellales bacterium]